MTTNRKYYDKPRIIDTEALSAGLFPGTSKRTFDVIHFEDQEATARGERLQMTRRELMRLAAIRNTKTLNSHLRHFARLGVLVVTQGESGNHKGNYYETRCDQFPSAIERTASRKIKLSEY